MLPKKVNSEKVTENGIFDFYCCMQKLSAYNFVGVNFFEFFSTDSDSAYDFCVLWYPYRILAKTHFLLILDRFANFKANRTKTAEKNEKHTLYCKCVLDSHFTSIFGVWEAPFCQKKVKGVVPYYSIQLISDDYQRQ